ncbi:ADM_collapsed_G0050550.mRNA.1.CDS.1 [Saccharomyces cerevisiae]|nr:ADM_collapsed_G0050550.mRNA.1.CDS.1 [Saccharomyces cerevisiae]
MFAAIASGNPLQLSVEVPNSNGLQHTIVLSRTKPKLYSHITLFILPNVTFPQDYIATVLFQT